MTVVSLELKLILVLHVNFAHLLTSVQVFCFLKAPLQSAWGIKQNTEKVKGFAHLNYNRASLNRQILTQKGKVNVQRLSLAVFKRSKH